MIAKLNTKNSRYIADITYSDDFEKDAMTIKIIKHINQAGLIHQAKLAVLLLPIKLRQAKLELGMAWLDC